jgi:serine/threonine-protein kinase SRPK3
MQQLLLLKLSNPLFFFLGKWTAGIPIPKPAPLKVRESALLKGNVQDREAFLRFMGKMLQWEPGKRSTARELVDDEWISKHTTTT